MAVISEQQFRSILQKELGGFWDRALRVFRDYGPTFAYDVTHVLRHAVGQKKVNEVLDILEKHYHDHLQFQHPEIRAAVNDQFLGFNPTRSMFLSICQYTLELRT